MAKQVDGKQGKEKVGSRTRSGKKKVEFQGYVNWSLSDKHKVSFDKWLGSEPDVDDLVYKALDGGYSLKFRYDLYNQCLSAALYCEDVGSPNGGWVLSMRSNDWYRALMRLLFVHYIAFEEQWVTSKEEQWSEDNW